MLLSRRRPSSLPAGEGSGRAHTLGPAVAAQRIRGQGGQGAVAVAQIRGQTGSGESGGTRLVSDCVQRSPQAGNPKPDFGSTVRCRGAPWPWPAGPDPLPPPPVQPVSHSRLYISFFLFLWCGFRLRF